MAAPRKRSEDDTPRRAPARTREAREDQLSLLALDLAEKQIRAGTASTPVIVHYLKISSTREKLEKEQLIQKNRLLQAQVESYGDQKRTEAIYAEALAAMREYSGQSVQNEEDNYDR